MKTKVASVIIAAASVLFAGCVDLPTSPENLGHVVRVRNSTGASLDVYDNGRRVQSLGVGEECLIGRRWYDERDIDLILRVCGDEDLRKNSGRFLARHYKGGRQATPADPVVYQLEVTGEDLER